MYFREVLSGLLTGLAAKPLKHVGMNDAELQVFLVSVRKALNDTKVHSYFNFISWWGQK